MAAVEDVRSTWTLVAGADLSSAQYSLVKVDASGQAVLAGAGEAAVGVLQNDPESGEAATIAIGGVSKCRAGGSVDEGNVTSDASGKATADSGGSYVIGQALSAAGGADEFFTLLITHAGVVTESV